MRMLWRERYASYATIASDGRGMASKIEHAPCEYGEVKTPRAAVAALSVARYAGGRRDNRYVSGNAATVLLLRRHIVLLPRRMLLLLLYIRG